MSERVNASVALRTKVNNAAIRAIDGEHEMPNIVKEKAENAMESWMAKRLQLYEHAQNTQRVVSRFEGEVQDLLAAQHVGSDTAQTLRNLCLQMQRQAQLELALAADAACCERVYMHAHCMASAWRLRPFIDEALLSFADELDTVLA